MRKSFKSAAAILVLASLCSANKLRSQPTEALSNDVIELQKRPQVLVVDVHNNGLRIDSSLRTTMLTGKNERFRWTRLETDDGLLGISSFYFELFNVKFRIMDNEGHDLTNGFGQYYQPVIFFQKGIKVQKFDYNAPVITATSAWHMLKIFDENGDNKIDPKDKVWNAMRVFTDRDGDGVLYATSATGGWTYGSAIEIWDAGIISISLSYSANQFDAAGNLRADGSFTFSNGKKGLVSAVSFKPATDSMPGQLKDEVSTNKFVISSGKNINLSQGRLLTDFPEGVEWSVDIYSGANKFLINRSSHGKHGKFYNLGPGNYHFKLNTVQVNDIPIEKGKATRLKAGVLHITSNNHWELRLAGTNKFLTSGNKATKFALPVGTYQLTINRQSSTLEITDGQIVQF